MKLTYPVKGVGQVPGIIISQKFGENYQIYHDAFGMNGHNGWDFAAPLGTPVYAPHDGWIIENVQKDTGYGLRTQIYFEEDGYGWEVILGHFKTGSSQFEEIPYNQGNRQHFVRQGDLIAQVNSTGFSTGNHTHLGLKQYKNGQLLNANNGFFGSIDPGPYLIEEFTMKLVKDNADNTTYIVAGSQNKVKIGIADPESLALFGDETVEQGSTAGIPQTFTVSKGFILNKK